MKTIPGRYKSLTTFLISTANGCRFSIAGNPFAFVVVFTNKVRHAEGSMLVKTPTLASTCPAVHLNGFDKKMPCK